MTTAVADLHEPTAMAASGRSRDRRVDSMRGVAILMVIGIHALDHRLAEPWLTLVNAALRPAVAIFLFLSGYLTIRNFQFSLKRRLASTLIPYVFAFSAAYAYMAVQNPLMNHRFDIAIMRFIFGYIFVYYYIFVYACCLCGLRLVIALAYRDPPAMRQRLTVLSAILIVFGLVAGAYLDPVLQRLGVADGVIDELRLRDVPFWFSFMMSGALAGVTGTLAGWRPLRALLVAPLILAYLVYAGVRVAGIGDAAAYDSVAYFAYAILSILMLLALRIDSRALPIIGRGSYFIYLWHIFVIYVLRDYLGVGALDPIAASLTNGAAALAISLALLLLVRHRGGKRLTAWLGA